MKHDPDREVVLACQARREAQCESGDEAPFRALHERHRPWVYSLCYRLLGNHADALDASQETFLLVFRHIDRFRHESKFSSWLHRVTVNACRELARREKRHRRTARDPDEGDAFDEGSQWLTLTDSEARSPADEALVLDLARHVEAALARLPLCMRETLSQRFHEGKGYAEVARDLGVAEGTVKSRLHRGLAALSAELVPRLAGGEG